MTLHRPILLTKLDLEKLIHYRGMCLDLVLFLVAEVDQKEHHEGPVAALQKPQPSIKISCVYIILITTCNTLYVYVARL